MMSYPIPAPRTPKGRQVARIHLGETTPALTTASSAEASAQDRTDISALERILMASRSEDFNLSALINSVEKDIWYLEQLESNSSVLRRKTSPHELPFPITDELLKLPGYRPRFNASPVKALDLAPEVALDLPPEVALDLPEVDKRRKCLSYRPRFNTSLVKALDLAPEVALCLPEVTLYLPEVALDLPEVALDLPEVDKRRKCLSSVEAEILLNELPPVLPPKARQRRHSDNVTSVTEAFRDSGDEELFGPVVDAGLVHQRLLPRDNTVTNAIYSQRLPSPHMIRRPPSAEPVRVQDDGDYPGDHGGVLLKRLNCPLCVQTFGYSFGLECHLLSVHQDDLQAIRSGKILFTSPSFGCSCCCVTFLKPDILVQHILETHPDFVMSCMLQQYSSDFFNEDKFNSLQRRHFECTFCGQKFLRRHQKTFLLHLDQKHLMELQSYMQDTDMIMVKEDMVKENMVKENNNINDSLEVKLLRSLANKVRITSAESKVSRNASHSQPRGPTRSGSSSRRSSSAHRVKADRSPPMLNQSLDLDHQYMSITTPAEAKNHHYQVVLYFDFFYCEN
jgi:hypothetical protein